MKELSLHILDIVQNSIVADATLVEVNIYENTNEDVLLFSIIDNGKGMDEELVQKVTDPFITSRTTRKVGLGIPLLKAAAEAALGNLSIFSKVGEGTTIKATFVHSHIDRQPLGDIGSTMVGLISSNPNIDFLYKHNYNGNEFFVDTKELKAILDGVSLSEPSVAAWLFEYFNEGIENLYGGNSV